jgi:peptide/nickel transport system permease protein
VLRYTLNRLALGLVSILILSMIVYAAAQVLPGNPGRLVLGREATPEAVAKFNKELGYDKPLPVRYLDWLSSAIRGDFGANYSDGRPVTDDLVPALKRSAFLALYALLLCVPLSIVAGVIAAVRRGRPTDRLITISGLSLAVIPEFVLGAILVAIFGPAFLGWFPGIAGALIDASLPTKLDSLFLPAVALALVLFGYIARITRAAPSRPSPPTTRGRQRWAAPLDRSRTARRPEWPAADGRGRCDADRLPLRRDRRDREALRLPGDWALTLTSAQVKNFPMLSRACS